MGRKACNPSHKHSISRLAPAGAHSAQDRALAPLQTNLISFSSAQQEVKEWFHWAPDAQLEPVTTSEAAAALPGMPCTLTVPMWLCNRPHHSCFRTRTRKCTVQAEDLSLPALQLQFTA